MATIRDVAKQAGVSISTVSLVLNNNPVVKLETRYRVFDAIRELNYKPNQSARSLVTKQSKVIGVIKGKGTEKSKDSVYSFEGLVDTYLTEMLRSIERQMDVNGYSMMIDWDFDPENAKTTVPVLDPNRVDGVMYVGGFLSEQCAHMLKEAGIPAVLIGSRHEDFDYVDTYPDHGMRKAVEYLASRGHRDIAFINGPESSHSSARKLQGYLSAMEAIGLPVNDAWLTCGDYTGKDGYEAARHLCAGEKRPSAVVASVDCVAVGAMRYFYEQGIYCPRDISIVGFEDSILSEYSVPPLTSVRVCKDTLGEEGAKVLFNRIQKPKSQPVRLCIEPELILRDSVADV